MIALTTAVAIAVTCSVIFMVSAVVITIVWIKIRQERRSLALIQARQSPYAHGLQTFPAETLTELSREEGSALSQYGHLPYGRPTEWGLLASRESLVQSADDKPPIQLLRKARSFSLRHSISSKSRRNSRSLARPGSLTTLTEASEGPYSQSMFTSNEDLVVSAVDGVLELPTKTTPRQTPEREDYQPSTDITIRPISGPWPGGHQRERSSALFPVLEDHYEGSDPTGARGRGGSITSQTAGVAPDQPAPPPPCAYPPNRFRLSKNDSTRFSSLSLETADSSVLNDSRRTSTNIEASLASPALPPCRTFAPFSANDVGRDYDRSNVAANAAPFVFPANSPVRKGQSLDSERTSPRRSLTACSPTRSSERISPPPRRSESLSAKQSRDNISQPYLDLDHIPPLSTTGRSAALLPHFSQMQRHSMHGSPQRDSDPFYIGTSSSHSLTYNPYAAGRRASSFFSQDTAMQAPNSQSKPPLTSALKGSGHRKGHRRQNCVRISIHPPITFAGPTFSPTVEEPEEVEDFGNLQLDVSDLSTSNVSRNSSVSAVSTANRTSLQDAQFNRRISQIIKDPDDSWTDPYGSPTKKRKQTQPDSGSLIEKALPGILTSLPTTTDRESLSHTPSPERNPSVWRVPDYQGSHAQLENSPAPGSPRRSAVMGPRSQPGKPARNSYQSLIPPEDNGRIVPPQSARPPRNHSIKEPPRNPSMSYSLRRVKSEAREHTPSRSHSQSDKKRASHYITTTSPNPHRQNPPGTQISMIVPIWEDQNKKQVQAAARRSTVSLVYDPPQLYNDRGDISDISPRRNQSVVGDKMTRMSSYRNSRHGCTTPTRKTAGLGIDSTTPGSLYDGDGFLKE
ncbi:hypothetical protein BDW59DRAFT_180405 [Aspergillus cavernicola]|uniref:Uncharacterized protein n=1 Tax=Aspergillus cavernicola TaxID=176166 RepID=A0ABR4I8D9_9EURO